MSFTQLYAKDTTAIMETDSVGRIPAPSRQDAWMALCTETNSPCFTPDIFHYAAVLDDISSQPVDVLNVKARP